MDQSQEKGEDHWHEKHLRIGKPRDQEQREDADNGPMREEVLCEQRRFNPMQIRTLGGSSTEHPMLRLGGRSIPCPDQATVSMTVIISGSAASAKAYKLVSE